MRYGGAGVVLSVTVIAARSQQQAAAAASVFTDDAVWILPDASSLKGKDEIQQGATAFITSFGSVTVPAETIDKVIVASNSEIVSFATGKYTIYMKGKKAGEAHASPFADYWKKGPDGLARSLEPSEGTS